MVNKGFRTVSIPLELIEEVEALVKNRKLGYTSVAEFVKEALRDKLAEMKTSR